MLNVYLHYGVYTLTLISTRTPVAQVALSSSFFFGCSDDSTACVITAGQSSPTDHQNKEAAAPGSQSAVGEMRVVVVRCRHVCGQLFGRMTLAL